MRKLTFTAMVIITALITCFTIFQIIPSNYGIPLFFICAFITAALADDKSIWK